MKRLFVLLVLSLCAWGASALPTVDQVQSEIRQGRYTQAETMMQEVVAARPGSARGRYVYAEILAHNGKREQALQEVRLARQLDPELRFADPEKVHAFEQSLQRPALTPQPSTSRPSSGEVSSPAVRSGSSSSSGGGGLPGWIWGVGGLIAALLVWQWLRSRARSTAQGPAMAGGMGMGGVPYGQPGPGGMGGGGSGNNGMLGAGLAGVGGFAAGMLAEKLLHGQNNGGNSGNQGNADTGGLLPGHFADQGGSSDNNGNDIDFGHGSNDWSDNSSSDSGGGGGSSNDDW